MRDDELPIIRDWYEFSIWMIPKIGKFPRDHRFTLGERIERLLYQVLELLVRARFAKPRRPLLEQVNVELEILRFQLRMAKDLHCLPIKSWGQSAEKINEVGKQVGGWLKSEARTPGERS